MLFFEMITTRVTRCSDWCFGPQVIRLGMFEVQAHQLTNSLAERAQALKEKLVARVLEDHQEDNQESVG